MPKKDINKSDMENVITLNLYQDRLTDLAINRFEWINLPPEIDERFLEYQLFINGYILFFKDEIVDKYAVAKCTLGQQWNIYDIPTERIAYSNNGIMWNRNNKDSVIIFNNRIWSNTVDVANFYAQKLTNIERTMDVNLMHTVTPYIIGCDEKQRLSFKNLFNKVFNKEPVIYGARNLTELDKSFKLFNTNTKFMGIELNELKKQIFNEYLTCIGIPNLTVNKKERLVSDEVERNQGGVIAQQFTGLNTRKRACEQINNIFGLNVDVQYREMESEEKEDGRIHDTNTDDISEFE